jgi:hypothetical protein
MYSKLMGECWADDSGKYFLGGGSSGKQRKIIKMAVHPTI